MKLQQLTTAICILINLQIEVHGHCGKRLVQHKALVFNGFESNEGDWPWHAAIFHISAYANNFSYKCGGTLLNSNTILTAAHCVCDHDERLIAQRVLVYLGLYSLLKPSGTNSKVFEVFEIIPHPSYSSSTYANDIGIIRLSTEVTFTNYIQPICLWDSNEVAVSKVTGKFGTVVGWGYTEKNEVSPILRQATMPVVSLTTCLESNRDFFGQFVSSTTFCAGFKNGTTVCSGDSGGSLTFEDNGVYRIRGIVSLSAAMSKGSETVCNSKEYVVFTDVAQYLTWIYEVVPKLENSQSGNALVPKLENSSATASPPMADVDIDIRQDLPSGIKCEWRGTSPLCSPSSCDVGDLLSGEADSYDSAKRYGEYEFGDNCWFGTKKLCCFET